MYSTPEAGSPGPRPAPTPLARELATILEMRQRVLESRELNYCSVLTRALIEDEIPRLVALICARR